MIKNINNLDNRLVKFKRISSDGTVIQREVELRSLQMAAGEPRSATVRLSMPGGNTVGHLVTTIDYDSGRQKFSEKVGNDIWESDFDWSEYVRSNRLGNADSYIKSPRRHRQQM